MNLTINTITTGHYKNAEIILKGTNADTPVLVSKKFLNKMEIPMDHTTIKKLSHFIIEDAKHEIIIEWKDGKLSQGIFDAAVYAALKAKVHRK